MMPVRRTQSWLPSIFNDFFDNDWMVKANATAPAINVLETEKEYKVELAAPGMTKTRRKRKTVAICVANSHTLSSSKQ